MLNQNLTVPQQSSLLAIALIINLALLYFNVGLRKIRVVWENRRKKLLKPVVTYPHMKIGLRDWGNIIFLALMFICLSLAQLEFVFALAKGVSLLLALYYAFKAFRALSKRGTDSTPPPEPPDFAPNNPPPFTQAN